MITIDYKSGSSKKGEDGSVFGGDFGFADFGTGKAVTGAGVVSSVASGTFALGGSSGPLRPQPETINAAASAVVSKTKRIIAMSPASKASASVLLRV